MHICKTLSTLEAHTLTFYYTSAGDKYILGILAV